MHPGALIAYFFGGCFLTNALPHFLMGLAGRGFPSPFAKPSGIGLSSPVVNVLWGFANLVIGYGLVFHVGAFDIRSLPEIAAAGAGSLLLGLGTASHFGKVLSGSAV